MKIRCKAMGRQRVALMGDTTTTGGRIIASEDCVRSDEMAMALVGDKVYCPKCDETGAIIEGCSSISIQGKPVAYNGCLIACGCPVGTHHIVATKSFTFVDAPESNNATSASANMAARFGTSNAMSGYSSFGGNNLNNASSSSPFSHFAEPKNDIRIDAKKLIQCAEEVCEKHLYYPEIKQAFMDDITAYAQQIVTEVESGQKPYEQGRNELKKEEKNIEEQAKEWVLSGLSVLGGIGMTMAGVALCTTGWGCIIGAFLVGHGANGIEEGVRGIITGDSNQSGFLKDAYKASARGLGFDEGVGELAYDLVDLGISVHGKLQLIPKLNEYGNPVRKLFYYGRKDLEMAYKQMSKRLLAAEIFSDVIALSSAVKQAGKLFILDKTTNQVNMVVGEPESVTNVGDIVENCELYIKITGYHNEEPGYYRCTDAQGERYQMPF